MSALTAAPHSNPKLPDRTIGPAELAKLFNVHKATIFSWERSGAIPRGRRIGGSVRWTEADIAPLLVAGQEGGHDA
jgi:predicted DNA-binding transcriptional regulator AlpA